MTPKTIDDALSQEIERSTEQGHFSQGSEQEFILRAVGAVPKNGRFLDIGAWNAVAKSNTRALYELGWSGVMIEPSPGPMRNLIADYGNDPRIQLVSAAVAVDGDRIARMHISDDALSTTEEKQFNKWKVDAHFDGMLIVPVISVTQILEYFGEFDFISIDTEGTSVAIFEEFLRIGAKPACICVEYDDRKSWALHYAEEKHYRLIHENENNLIFQRSA
jgi:FkbM family methyltransferase